ncbi:MAG: hypothetical protein IPH30_16635 [Betaproteobacteria bacterium]|nr:hypothetical protein [Betaproteobacteria bacterium]
MHYNYFRDYDPAIGRYIQSDPLGLAGGLGTFTYTDGMPLRAADPLGLASTGGQNSCGAAGGRRYPNKFPGYSFEPACQNHDRCYEMCGASKAKCDNDFLRDMLNECGRIPWAIAIFGGQARTCKNAAMSYNGAVVVGGGQAFRDAKEKACQRCRP